MVHLSSQETAEVVSSLLILRAYARGEPKIEIREIVQTMERFHCLPEVSAEAGSAQVDSFLEELRLARCVRIERGRAVFSGRTAFLICRALVRVVAQAKRAAVTRLADVLHMDAASLLLK